jgi:serine/threonine protein kinase
MTEFGETVGAKFFMAPEQERGGVTEVSEASDIYALGKLLHFLLTSRFLYREELSKAFEDNELKIDERLEVIRDTLLARMIVEDASKRIQSADEVLAIVTKMLTDFKKPSQLEESQDQKEINDDQQ